MTISNQVASVYYTGDDVTTQFPVPFRFDDSTELIVSTVLISSGAATVLGQGQYTVTGAGNDNGGTVVYTPALSSLYKIVIQRNMPLAQTLAMEQESGLILEDIEYQLDRMVMMIQQVRAELAAAAGNGQISSIVQNVTGPASAVADRIATFADSVGNRVKDGELKLADLALVSHTHPENFVGLMKQNAATVISNSTLASDSELQFAMAANMTYVIRGQIFLNAPATPGWKIGATGPALPTRVISSTRALDDTSAVTNYGVSAYGTINANNPAATRNLVVEIYMVVKNGANAGTFAIQFAQNVANAAATTFFKGSYIEYKAV